MLVVFRGWLAAFIPVAVAAVAVLGTFCAVSIIASLTTVSVFALHLTTALGLGLAVRDTVDAVTERIPLALAIIAATTLLLLFFMTGSILVPIKAVLLNLLSLTATFGALVWVFQQGHLSSVLGATATGRIDVFTPILMFCVAFGLSMDYEVFLLARVKESYDLGLDNVGSVAEGLGRTGGVVTAAVLLAVVFGAIATSEVTIVKMLGLGLALAVVVDAFVIRATLVPALMRLAGRPTGGHPGRCAGRICAGACGKATRWSTADHPTPTIEGPKRQQRRPHPSRNRHDQTHRYRNTPQRRETVRTLHQR